MPLAEEKAELRKYIRQRRNALSPEEKADLDRQLLYRLQRHPWMQEADVVLTYYSGKSEPDTHELIDWLFWSGRKVALPVCENDGEMAFYLLSGTAELSRGAFGIPEPIGRDKPVLTEKTLCIVPGLAFTENGARLGQGGGYYDRFMQRHPALRTIGLTYRCLMQEALPCEAHDCWVDIVITEEGTAMQTFQK